MQTNVDCIIVTDSLIKLNFSPYILILDLADEIDDTHVQAKSVNQKLIIDLRKKSSRTWGSLISTLTKKELEQRRNQSIERRRVYDLEVSTESSYRPMSGYSHSLRYYYY